MTIQNRSTRAAARFVVRAGAIGSALMFVITAWAILSPAAAATNAGSAQVIDPSTKQPKTSGGSATDFTLKLPTSSACTGDSANDGYRVQSYMVASSVDPATLQYDASGPTPQAFENASFREPLFDSTSNPYVNAQTAAASPPPGPGPIVNIPAFNFKVYSPGNIPAGTYNVGIACTKGPASATQLDKYWNTQMTFTTAASDSPAQVTWTAQATSGTTTTTAGSGGSTTTTAGAGGSTTTTSAGSGSTTTTTKAGSTTTTTASGSGSTTTTTSSGAATATAADSSGNALAANSTLTGGQQITVSATGFAAGETVTIVANSTPVPLGTAVADGTGKVSTSVVIPTSLGAGAHTITLTGAAKTATFPFTIAASSSGAAAGSGSGSASTSGSGGSQLPFTGADPLGLFIWAALLVVFGRMAILLGRPLRQRREVK